MEQAEAALMLDRWAGDAETPPPALQHGQRGVAIRLSRAVKAFGSRVVLDQLDLDVAPGEFVSVVGRSGEGKSTLLRLLTGLDRPQSGQVALGGMPVTGTRPDVTMMFQDSRLLPWETVIGNVGVARTRGWREQARSVLREVGLGERAGDWPAALSGGQRQRVALARALMGRPGLLLLDEPLGALDALTRADMQRLIERIWQKAAFTAVLVTHDVTEAVALSDRVLVLSRGRIKLDLPVRLARPRHRSDPGAAVLEERILGALEG